jgi:hypothetical protein
VTYTRQPAHWAVDTAGRRRFEQKVRKAFDSDGEFVLLDSTDSFDEIDFELGCRGRRMFVEVKQKKQRYREAWVEASGIDESNLFILDELAARKIIRRCPRSYLLIHDELQSRFSVAGALELITMPKRRINRSIDAAVSTYKGKWLMDLTHGEVTDSLDEAVAYLKRRSVSEDEYWGSLACHGRYDGENLPRL